MTLPKLVKCPYFSEGFELVGLPHPSTIPISLFRDVDGGDRTLEQRWMVDGVLPIELR